VTWTRFRNSTIQKIRAKFLVNKSLPLLTEPIGPLPYSEELATLTLFNVCFLSITMYIIISIKITKEEIMKTNPINVKDIQWHKNIITTLPEFNAITSHSIK
jgi:hypothetical protein